jgi:very-short-patch-repair endonuclease
MDRIDAAIGALAKQQHGVFTCAQSSSLGMSAKTRRVRLAHGTYEHVHRHVLRVAGAPETWRQRVMTAVLAAGPGSAASHTSAGVLRRVDGCEPGEPQITTPTRRHLAHDDVQVFRKHDLAPIDVSIVDGIPTTTVARTLIDLAAVFDFYRLQEAVDGAIRDGLVSKSRLWWRWGELRRRGRNGIALMGKVLELIDGEPVPRSVLERRFMRAIEHLHLPRVRRQHVVKHPGGRHVATLDFAIPELKIAFEVSGHGTHATRGQRRADMIRRNELEAMGWTVYEFTYEQVCFEPEYVARIVRQAVLCAVRAA